MERIKEVRNYPELKAAINARVDVEDEEVFDLVHDKNRNLIEECVRQNAYFSEERSSPLFQFVCDRIEREQGRVIKVLKSPQKFSKREVEIIGTRFPKIKVQICVRYDVWKKKYLTDIELLELCFYERGKEKCRKI
jgi:hypothetical protein